MCEDSARYELELVPPAGASNGLVLQRTAVEAPTEELPEIDMSRRSANTEPPVAAKQWQETRHRAGDRETWSAECRLVTPMYGGGVEAGEVDRLMPIGGSGDSIRRIRGQYT